MKYLRLIMMFIASISLVASCVKFDYSSVTTHPTQGKVTVTTDWDNDGSDIVGDGIVIINGEEITVNPDGSLPLMDEGEYEILTYNDVPTIEVKKSPVSTENPAGNVSVYLSVTDGFIEPIHDKLYAGMIRIKVQEDTETVVEKKINPISKVLAFKLAIGDGDPDRITQITATLSGISEGWDLSNNKPIGDAVSVAPPFTKKVDNATGRSVFTRTESKTNLDASVVLLGISKNAEVTQVLTLSLTFDDGRKQTIISDVTSELADFNDDKSIIKTLTGTVKTPKENNTTGTITDWDSEDGGDLDLN